MFFMVFQMFLNCLFFMCLIAVLFLFVFRGRLCFFVCLELFDGCSNVFVAFYILYLVSNGFVFVWFLNCYLSIVCFQLYIGSLRFVLCFVCFVLLWFRYVCFTFCFVLIMFQCVFQRYVILAAFCVVFMFCFVCRFNNICLRCFRCSLSCF